MLEFSFNIFFSKIYFIYIYVICVFILLILFAICDIRAKKFKYFMSSTSNPSRLQKHDCAHEPGLCSSSAVTRFSGHCVLIGGTQRRAFAFVPEQRNENIKK